jgi:hypothetical protein
MVVVSVLPRSICVAVIVVSISVLLCFLDITEVGIQPFEALLPMPSVLADQIGDIAASRPSREVATVPPPLLDEPGPPSTRRCFEIAG